MSMIGTGMAEETTDRQRVEAKKAAAPVERRAAVNFFIMLGTPEEYNKPEILENWVKLMREAMGYLEIKDLEEFKKFLNWALEINEYSAKYLREANDPARSLVKNMESLKKRYNAYLKAHEII